MVTFAQRKVTVTAGTPIPLHATTKTKAAKVRVGQKVAFTVARDINVDGAVAIPFGTTVSGMVYEAKRSSWWGTKGRLGIKVTEIVLPTGEVLPLINGDTYITGTNRTPLSVTLSLLFVWPAMFICGSKAVMPAGYEVQTSVAANTTVTVQ